MNWTHWAYFALGVISYQILKMIILIVRNESTRLREKRFLRQARVTFPDAGTITMTAIETSDKKAMDDLRRQLLSVSDPHIDVDDEYEMDPFPDRP